MNYTKLPEIETQDLVSDFYEGKRYTLSYSWAYHQWWSRKMLSFIQPKGRILDNGCGTGHFSEFLKGLDVTGLDISARMLGYARKRYQKVIQGDAQNLPFTNDYFDLVLAKGLLHHLPNPQRGVTEIYRVLRKGGEVVFSDTLNSILTNLPRRILKRSKHFSQEHKNFKRSEIIKIIDSKLSIEEIYYFGYLAYPLLGFPDIINIYKYFPAKKIVTPLLIKIDELISKIPFLNRQACGIIILARKNN
jgi:ubiquinone/menaquinone biosynthesis C-methylase UbiE